MIATGSIRPLATINFVAIEVLAGNMLSGGLQEIASGLRPGEQVVSNALVLQATVEQ